MLSLLCSVMLAPNAPVWSDEFDGKALDSTKWEAPKLNRQGDQSRWDPSLVSVKDGHLVLKVRRTSGETPKFACGAVRSRKDYDPKQTMFAQRYGRFEARVRLPKQLRTDVWFAFWIMAGDIRDGQTDSTRGTEIDIMESFNAFEGKVSRAFHWGGYGSTLNSAGFSPKPVAGLLSGGFHTYGLRWSKEAYEFTVDGQAIERTDAVGLGRKERVLSNGTCREPGYLKLTTEATAWSGPTPNWEPDAPQEDEVLVDWVRVWKSPNG